MQPLGDDWGRQPRGHSGRHIGSSGGYVDGWWVWLWLVLCSVQHVKLPIDARPCPPLSAHTCANVSHSLCNSARSHRFNLQIQWYEFKHKDGNNHVYERGDPNGHRWR
jgi:hypothetical protein